MKPRTIAAAALAWTMAATGAAGQECEADGSNCFDLWTGCAPISPLIGVGDNEIGMERADVVNAVESRLRAARILDPSGLGSMPPSLVVRVRFAGPAFDVFFGFLLPGVRMVRDDYGFRGVAPTWQQDTFGTHGGDAAFVMESVRRFLDQFMNDYLRVNGPACEAR